MAHGRLAAVSMGLFLGPAVLALAGAFCLAPQREAQWLGAAAGLGVGMAVSVAAWKRYGPMDEDSG